VNSNKLEVSRCWRCGRTPRGDRNVRAPSCANEEEAKRRQLCQRDDKGTDDDYDKHDEASTRFAKPLPCSDLNVRDQMDWREFANIRMNGAALSSRIL
jgi:hypothetical protein